MNHTIFYRGLLFAYREKQTEFVAEGERFHDAFKHVLEVAAAQNFGPAQEMLNNFDPIFGVFPDANEMLLEAERDFILAMLNPHLQHAQFKISADRARTELDRLPAEDVRMFRRLAEKLDEELRS